MNKFDYHLYKFVGQAVRDFNLIDDGDRILVCLSGGKDSYTLLHVLERLQRIAPVKFSIHLLHIHPGFPEFKIDSLIDFMKESGHEYTIHYSSIAEDVFEDEEKLKDVCFYCARQRRSIIYRMADEIGVTKIALGHHLDDFIESAFMSMIYNSKIETMMPKIPSPRDNFHIIRPLVYVQEKIIKDLSVKLEFNIIKDLCPHHNGGNSSRAFIKDMINEIEANSKGAKGRIMNSLKNVNLKRLLDKRYNPEIYE